MKFAGLLRPEYLLRPQNILRRLRRRPCPGRVVLPIGTTGGQLRVCGDEYLGLNLRTFGVYDLCITEALRRLTPAGSMAVDVGANIGYTAVVMGLQLGPKGQLFALEPVPELFAELEYNLDLNGLRPPAVRAIRAAASAQRGTLRARVAVGSGNDGLFSLETATAVPAEGGTEIETVRLDDLLADVPRVDVLKIDVEGHEAQTLAGAAGLLAAGRIRTVVYEDHHPHPSVAYELLISHGMRVWRLDAALRGPVLIPPGDSARPTHEPNWVASLDPDAVSRALAPRGWTVF